eukprot:TRINITY_DN20085_c0_g1_i1.p1 TRINITY_DN20085_c0_g1~~TRINITY_DN20085_c0_g1_i1.p1  ORF type:complete len:459 (+),score=139.36 TRINITY_DN20085_c0_g1_i1:101-1477(+)
MGNSQYNYQSQSDAHSFSVHFSINPQNQPPPQPNQPENSDSDPEIHWNYHLGDQDSSLEDPQNSNDQDKGSFQKLMERLNSKLEEFVGIDPNVVGVESDFCEQFKELLSKLKSFDDHLSLFYEGGGFTTLVSCIRIALKKGNNFDPIGGKAMGMLAHMINNDKIMKLLIHLDIFPILQTAFTKTDYPKTLKHSFKVLKIFSDRQEYYPLLFQADLPQTCLLASSKILDRYSEKKVGTCTSILHNLTSDSKNAMNLVNFGYVDYFYNVLQRDPPRHRRENHFYVKLRAAIGILNLYYHLPDLIDEEILKNVETFMSCLKLNHVARQDIDTRLLCITPFTLFSQCRRNPFFRINSKICMLMVEVVDNFSHHVIQSPIDIVLEYITDYDEGTQKNGAWIFRLLLKRYGWEVISNRAGTLQWKCLLVLSKSALEGKKVNTELLNADLKRYWLAISKAFKLSI